MTLSELLAKTLDHSERDKAGCLVVYPSDRNRTAYFGLSDYLVSSVGGPCLWMVPRVVDVPCPEVATHQGYQPKTGVACNCRPGKHRDNCPDCEGTGLQIDFAAIRARTAAKRKVGRWD